MEDRKQMFFIYSEVLSQHFIPPSGLLYGGKLFKYKDKVRMASANEELENRSDCSQEGYNKNCVCSSRSNWKTLKVLKKTSVLQRKLQVNQTGP